MRSGQPHRAGQAGQVRRRTLLGAPFAAAVAATGLSACGGGSSDGTTTLTFANWADSETATRPGIEAAIKKFEAAHPKIKIKSDPISFTDIGHTLVLRTQSGNPPDVAELSGNDTFSLAATGALEALDSYASGVTSSMIPTEVKESKYQGKLIAWPWTVNPPALWFNKRLMGGAGLDPSKPPTTIDELMTALAAVHAKYPKAVGIGLDTTNRDFGLTSNWSWMKTFGATPFHGSTPTANTAPMKAYLTWMRELAQKGYISAGHKIGDFRPLAAQNQVAFVWDQPVFQGVVQSTNHQPDMEFFQNWGVTPLPTGPTGKAYSVELGHQLVMFNKTSNKQAAWQFINWLATNTGAVNDYTVKYESSLPPLTTPAADTAKLLDTPVMTAFKHILGQVTEPEYGPTYEEAYPPIMAGVQDAVTSSKSIGSIASTMQSGLGDAFK